jgi:hypothetical protein
MPPWHTVRTVDEATRWRFGLAQGIAASYARNPKVKVVMVAGSVGRGCVDSYSDVEVDVYYSQPPTEAERVAAVEGCGATVERLGQDEDEWEERMSIGGFPAHTSTFLVATMERYLIDVIDRCELAPDAQTRLFSLQHAAPLTGHEQVERWRSRAAVYPEGLSHAMLEANLPFRRFWYAGEMLAARGDVPALYELVIEVARQLIAALHGLNRIYLPTPEGLKGMGEMIDRMQLKPDDLSDRLEQAFRGQPALVVYELEELIADTLELVEAHVPDFDTGPFRVSVVKRRRAWDAPPPELSSV